LQKRCFDAFNRHDLEAVMACFHDKPRIVDPQGKVSKGAPKSTAATKPPSP
jgi:hypothetical protein